MLLGLLGLGLGAAACLDQTVEVLSATPGTGLCRTMGRPAEGAGLQLETATVEVPSGAEVRLCSFRRISQDIDVVRLERALAVGARSVQVFLVNQDVPEGDLDCDAAYEQLS